MNDNDFFLNIQEKLSEIENIMHSNVQSGGASHCSKPFFVAHAQTIFMIISLVCFCLIFILR